MSRSRQDQLLDQIYDAAFDPDQWVRVMEELAKELSGETACMTVLDAITGEGGGYTALVPDGTMDAYVSRWAQNNPLHEVGDPLSYIAGWRPATIRYEEWIERDALHRSGFFNEFLRPLGSENGIMMGLALIGTKTVTMNIARALRRGMFDDREIRLAGWWQNHLSRAVRLGREVQISQAKLDAIDHLIDTTPHRLFFLDTRGRIQRVSAAADALLCQSRDFLVADGVLTAALPDQNRHLRRLVAAAASRTASIATGSATRLRGGSGAFYDVSVTPLGPRGVATWSVEPIILVTISNAAGPALPVELRLRSRFGLTPAEARVTLALMAGGTLREIADGAQVSVNTVRSQLSSIFLKTGCRRQADLVRMLLSLDGWG